jgi:hypothetical protein
MFEDGPLELADRTLWFKDGLLHRTNGPAIECKSGQKLWLLEGKQVTEQEVLGHRQEIERQALELSDKLIQQQQYDVTVDHKFTVGHALPPFKKKADKQD